MSAWRASALAPAVLLVAGCTLLGRPVPQPTTYMLAVTPPMTTAAQPLRQSLRIGRVRVVPAYAAASLVYRTSDVHVITDPYNQLIAEPGALIADRLADWLDQGRIFISVSRPESSRAADLVLEATVTELYGDFRPHQTPAAVVTIQFSLIDQTGPRPMPVLVRTISRRADLPDTSPEALVRGYGVALTGILTALTGELRSVPPRP